MPEAEIARLRQEFLRRVCAECIHLRGSASIPSIADSSSKLSHRLAAGIIARLGCATCPEAISGQTAGARFESIVLDFLSQTLGLLRHLRPAHWKYDVGANISGFVQYRHLARLNELIEAHPEARSALGDYVVKPDVVVARYAITDQEINRHREIVASGSPPHLSPLRRAETDSSLILHASISCKLTLRSDRSQNARTEGLNLIRNRKGHTPHIAVVTAEPMPTRIASLALGTGDIDCVYHIALDELVAASRDLADESALDALNTMIEGSRLRDIADLPFDLIT